MLQIKIKYASVAQLVRAADKLAEPRKQQAASSNLAWGSINFQYKIGNNISSINHLNLFLNERQVS